MSDNWVVQNLENALNTWNEKLERLEVKINKEIRNYTESMFFGLSMRQFILSQKSLLQQ